MGFFRSSESKPSKSKSRFSFRRHSDDTTTEISHTKPHPAPLHPQTRKLHAPSQPSQSAAASSATTSASARPPAHPQFALSSTFVSSASTSASSSVTSPTALQQACEVENKKSISSISTTNTKSTSDSLVSTDTEDSDFLLGTPSESSLFVSTPRGSSSTSFDPAEHSTHYPSMTEKVRTPTTPTANDRLSARSDSNSHNNSSTSSSRGQRHSLVGYRQLHCSMSYKNRMAQGGDRDENAIRSSFTSSTSRRSESSRASSHSGGSSTFLHNGSRASLDHIDELVPAPVSSNGTTNDTTTDTATDTAADAAEPSLLLAGRMSELRMTEASVAALQTRRAFQQMVLAIEDDDSDDDSDSEGYGSFSRRSSNYVGSISSGGIVQLGADEYRKFQFRLRQVEELCQEQARKQAVMEETIEHEVQSRTKKVVDAMEKKIAIYKQVKDAEVERRISEISAANPNPSANAQFSSALSRETSHFGGMGAGSLPASLSSSPVFGTDSTLLAARGKPLEKIFHPRRTRKRLELLREHEERQKKEMEQFREFIRSTEMRSTMASSSFGRDTLNNGMTMDSTSGEAATARASIKALRDPHLTEDLLTASPSELIEMICVIRKHVSVQEAQLDEAKKLICAAIEAREEAEDTAREAVELTMELDSRLERASQEMVLIKDELRRSSEFSMRSSFLLGGSGSVSGSGGSNSVSSNHLLRTASVPTMERR